MTKHVRQPMISAAAFFCLEGEWLGFRRSMAELALNETEDATNFLAAKRYTCGVDRR